MLHQSRDTMLEEKKKSTYVTILEVGYNSIVGKTWNAVGLLLVKLRIRYLQSTRISHVNCDVRYSLYMSYSTILY